MKIEELQKDYPGMSGVIKSEGITKSISGIGSLSLITHGIWTGKFAIQISMDNGKTWHIKKIYSSYADANFIEELNIDGENFVLARMYAYEWNMGQLHYDFQFQH